MARLILDTGLLIADVRGQIDLIAVVDGDDVALPAVVVAEFLEGAYLSADASRAADLRRFVGALQQLAPVVDYTVDVAEHHAALLAHTRRTGTRRGIHDLVIAATARATDRTILTRDARARFDELPGVQARVVSS